MGGADHPPAVRRSACRTHQAAGCSSYAPQLGPRMSATSTAARDGKRLSSAWYVATRGSTSCTPPHLEACRTLTKTSSYTCFSRCDQPLETARTSQLSLISNRRRSVAIVEQRAARRCDVEPLHHPRKQTRTSQLSPVSNRRCSIAIVERQAARRCDVEHLHHPRTRAAGYSPRSCTRDVDTLHCV